MDALITTTAVLVCLYGLFNIEEESFTEAVSEVVKTATSVIKKDPSTKVVATDLTKLSEFDLLRYYAKVYDVPEALPLAICRRESYDCNHIYKGEIVKSHAGAIGMMQIMPSTFALYKRTDGDITNREDNASAGVKYLKKLYTQYNGNLSLTAAAYNAGENAVAHYGNNIPPYKETKEYVKMVTTYFLQFRDEG